MKYRNKSYFKFSSKPDILSAPNISMTNQSSWIFIRLKFFPFAFLDLSGVSN